jgi:pimeloyl-ACP methyl ester carboxylesterase
MNHRDVRLQIGDVLGVGEPCHLEASVYIPDDRRADEVRACLFAVPGGTYDRGYWNLTVEGHPGYSFATYATDRGCVLVTVDNLGTGASSRPRRPDLLNFDSVAAANTVAFSLVREMAAAGELYPDLPPLGAARWVGVGHSLGGQLMVVQQSTAQSFERIAVLGSSFLGNQEVGSGHLAESGARAGAEATMRAMAGESWSSGYLEVPRDLLRQQFHAGDVPEAVLEADGRTATVLPRELAVTAIAPAGAAHYVKRISVPVFLAYAERDMSPDPRREVSLYQASPDITLFLLPGSAHCHNMAGTRELLWGRLITWAAG